MTRPGVSRRAFVARLLAGAAGVWAADARAEVARLEDRGLGGTGAAPTDGGEERGGGDRGIGGTGVVGTIRRFGSIVVNDLRIAYPAGVAVTVDGRAATLADLRLGHVVEVLAERRSGRLSTRRIAVAHEVVGPVEAVEGGGLRVLGQAVALWEGAEAEAWHAGDVVAVSGLRRLDGVIAASLIEPHEGAELRVAGTVEAGPGGALRVGGLQLADLPARFVGARVVLRGRMREEALAVTDVALAGSALLARRPKRLSVESYVERRGAGLRLGAGFAVAGLPGGRALPEGRAVRAVVTARLGAGGDLRVEAVRIEERGHGHGGGRGDTRPGFGPGAPGRPGFGPPGNGLPGGTGGPPSGGLPSGFDGGGPPGFGGGPPGGFGGAGGGRGPGGMGGMGGRR